MSDLFVPTPHGYMPKNKVIEIDNTQRMSVSSDGCLIVTSKLDGSLVKNYGKISEKSAQLKTNEISSENYPGWQSYADASNISEFRTSWAVPAEPEKKEPYGLFYIWNGLAGGGLQPVLSWGYHGAMYEISNWAFVGDTYVHGTYMEINSGDIITGVISFDGIEENTWVYNVTFEGYPDCDLQVGRDTSANGVAEVMESYTQDMTQIPSSLYCAMYDINMTVTDGSVLPAEFNWSVSGSAHDTPSGYNTVIVDSSTLNGEIDIYFH